MKLKDLREAVPADYWPQFLAKCYKRAADAKPGEGPRTGVNFIWTPEAEARGVTVLVLFDPDWQADYGVELPQLLDREVHVEERWIDEDDEPQRRVITSPEQLA